MNAILRGATVNPSVDKKTGETIFWYKLYLENYEDLVSYKQGSFAVGHETFIIETNMCKLTKDELKIGELYNVEFYYSEFRGAFQRHFKSIELV